MTLFYEPPKVMIDGKEYQVRRLNIKDIFTIVGIISKASKAANNDDDFLKGKITVENTLNFLTTAIVYCEDDIVNFYASLIDVTPEEFAKMPMDAILDITEKLHEHEDLRSFFEKVKRLLPKDLLIMRPRQQNLQ